MENLLAVKVANRDYTEHAEKKRRRQRPHKPMMQDMVSDRRNETLGRNFKESENQKLHYEMGIRAL